MASELRWPEVIGFDVQVARYLLNHNRHRYLDIRAEEDFKKGHVKNAVNIPFYLNTPGGKVKNPDFVNQVLLVLGKEDQIVVGCGTGDQSMSATTDLRDAVSPIFLTFSLP
ncbi:hypothetical protein ACJIZ3_006132 [Penstemon smallii]|uniref:Rhodanese domain-containing protein n=1 Tax=Penstemon smallii TaxID=265156 RepID=A0ABD3S6Z2_9LAMI